MSSPTVLHFLLLIFGGWVNRQQQTVIDFLSAENAILRAKLGRRRIRFTDLERRRLARLGKRLGRRVLRKLECIVTPETILRWYRQLIAKKYDGSGVRRPARTTPHEIRRLIIQMASENSSWGYTRIQGALKNLGRRVGRSTIRRILLEEGFDPAPRRQGGVSWATFIKAHKDGLAAMDFFTVEALTLSGLIRYHVLFVIDVESRKVDICGVRHQPTGQWMQQMARAPISLNLL